MGRLFKINILQALALGESGRLEEAMELLIHCLKFTQDEGFMRVFLSEGQPMADLLSLSKKQSGWAAGPLHEYIDHLLNAFG